MDYLLLCVVTQRSRIHEIRRLPTVQIVFRHALFCESLETIGGSGRLSTEQAVTPDLFS